MESFRGSLNAAQAKVCADCPFRAQGSCLKNVDLREIIAMAKAKQECQFNQLQKSENN